MENSYLEKSKTEEDNTVKSNQFEDCNKIL